MACNSNVGRLIVDFLCLGAVWIPVGLLNLLGKPYQRGFFCDDESIRHPYLDSTVSNILLYIVGMGLPIVSMIIVEIVRVRSTNHGAYESVSMRIGSVRIPAVIVELAHLIAVFLFGAGCSQIATDIGKYSIGRLRPHFIDVCQPDILAANLTSCLAGSHIYIEDFQCTATDSAKLHDSRLSFPSGHASFSAYTMLYLALYLQARMNWPGSQLLKPLFQLSALMLTWYTGLSRVSDYKHHWSDVLAGFLIGIIASSLTALYISPLFRPKFSASTSLEPQDQRGIVMTNIYKEAMENPASV